MTRLTVQLDLERTLVRDSESNPMQLSEEKAIDLGLRDALLVPEVGDEIEFQHGGWWFRGKIGGRRISCREGSTVVTLEAARLWEAAKSSGE